MSSLLERLPEATTASQPGYRQSTEKSVPYSYYSADKKEKQKKKFHLDLVIFSFGLQPLS
ncbi:MAG: hypothetical protein KKI15_14200 [Proteobacteria bacterium]|nr:hypothetical protein [Pseudomonadota bacterium]MBU1419637.1 hypothetical protein [Pseudomonadota bacterium]